MRILFAAACLLTLSGCLVTPVERKFPDIPPSLSTGCAELQLTPPGTTKLSEVLIVVTENYSQYQLCSAKVEAWQRWYGDQKAIFESVK